MPCRSNRRRINPVRKLRPSFKCHRRYVFFTTPKGLRTYPNNLVVMRPSEKSEDKAAGQKRPEA